MTDKIDFPSVIASLDSDITSLTYYLDRVMKTSSDDISSHILGIMAQNVKLSLMYVLISGHPLHSVLGSSTLEQIRRVISILDGWYGVVILGTPGNAERFKHNLEKSVSLLVTMFRNRLTELTLMSEHDPVKTEVDQCEKQDIEKRLRENKWVWVLDKDSSESGKWWAIDGIRNGSGPSRSKELHLSRVIDLNGSKLKISIDFNRFDLSKLKLSTRPTLVETHRIVASMVCAKYIKMFGEGEWVYVEGVKVTEMADRSGNNFIKFDVVNVHGFRSSIDTTDVALYYSNALISVDKPEQLELAEGERLRDFLDKAGSNKYLTVTQLDDGKAATVAYVIEGVELCPVEVKDSILRLSFLDSIADNGFIHKRVDAIVFDRTNTYSFSNEPPSV